MPNALKNEQEQSDIVPPKKKRSIYYVGKFSHVLGYAWTEAEIRAMADELYDWMTADGDRIWLKGYFTEKGIPYKQAERLCDKSEYFEQVFGMCRDLQEQRIFEAGFYGRGKTPMSIFALKQMGWTDKGRDDDDDSQVIIDWGDPDEWERLAQEQQRLNEQATATNGEISDMEDTDGN
mgnify:CR=1 FL=1